jgi:hypothetical protein
MLDHISGDCDIEGFQTVTVILQRTRENRHVVVAPGAFGGPAGDFDALDLPAALAGYGQQFSVRAADIE